MLDGAAQVAHQRQAVGALSVEAALEERHRAAQDARLVERDPGSSHECVGVAAVPGEQGDADARMSIQQQA